MRFLKDKGPARLPDIAQALGLEQKDVGSAFGILSKEGALSMDGEKRAVISADWFLAAHAPLSADSPAARPRVAVARDLIAKAAAAPEGILEESVLDEAERAAMGGMARKRGAGDAAFRAAERERVWYRLSPGAVEVAAELKSQGVTGDELGAVTQNMLEKGTWKDATFRPYNINAPAARLLPGRRNAYVEFLEGVKDKLASLGFEEFDGGLVETEFWNSDALFMPQFHSARDIHDVYHLAEPTKAKSIEEPYLSQVAATHENGRLERKPRLELFLRPRVHEASHPAQPGDGALGAAAAQGQGARASTSASRAASATTRSTRPTSPTSTRPRA